MRTTETRTPTVKHMATNQPLLSNSHDHCRSDPLKKHNRSDALFLTHLPRTLPSSNPNTRRRNEMNHKELDRWLPAGFRPEGNAKRSDAWLLSAVVLVRCCVPPAGERGWWDGATGAATKEEEREVAAGSSLLMTLENVKFLVSDGNQKGDKGTGGRKMGQKLGRKVGRMAKTNV